MAEQVGEIYFDVMLKASSQIQQDFAKFPQTFDSAITVLEDAAMRANKRLDEMSGASAALTGITRGLTDVVNGLAVEMTGLGKEADTVGRNKAISDWASGTRVALSYLLDAADVLWQTLSVLGRNVAFVFKGVGTEIGGIGAQVAAVMRGDFEGARAIGDQMKADAAQRRAELDAADKATLSRAQTMGAKMREAWSRGVGGELMGPPKPQPKLKPNGGVEDGKKGGKFDEAAYLAGQRKVAASEINVINEVEAEKLRIAKKLLDERKISEKTYADAVVLIGQGAEQARVELMRKTQSEIDKQRKEDVDKAKEAWERKKAGEKAVADYIFNLTRAVDPLSALEQEYKGKLALVTQYEQLMAQAGVSAEEQAQLARTEITRTYDHGRVPLLGAVHSNQSAAQSRAG